MGSSESRGASRGALNSPESSPQLALHCRPVRRVVQQNRTAAAAVDRCCLQQSSKVPPGHYLSDGNLLTSPSGVKRSLSAHPTDKTFVGNYSRSKSVKTAAHKTKSLAVFGLRPEFHSASLGRRKSKGKMEDLTTGQLETSVAPPLINYYTGGLSGRDSWPAANELSPHHTTANLIGKAIKTGQTRLYDVGRSFRHRLRKTKRLGGLEYNSETEADLPPDGRRLSSNFISQIRAKLSSHRTTVSADNSPKASGNAAMAEEPFFITSHKYGPRVSSLSKSKGAKKKLINKHTKLFRELVENWSPQDLHCLLVEYEASLALRDLCVKADSVRPDAPTLKKDLYDLYVNGWCADVAIVYGDVEFLVHRSILSTRSPFFRQLLSNGAFGGSGDMIHLPIANLSRKILTNCRGSPFRCVDKAVEKLAEQPAPSDLVTVELFGEFLAHLYTGECGYAIAPFFSVAAADEGGMEPKSTTVYWLNRLRMSNNSDDECVNPSGLISANPLGFDLQLMLQSAKEGRDEDAVLVFLPSTTADCTQYRCPNANSSPKLRPTDFLFTKERTNSGDTGTSKSVKNHPVTGSCENPRLQECLFPCHSAVLAARSPFFRSLIQKRMKVERTESTAKGSQSGSSKFSSSNNSQPIRIVLDEAVIPRQYVPVLLHCIYTDVVDLSLIVPGCSANVNSLSEVQAIAAGKSLGTPLDEATEIYQIAQFLEFDRLAQGCEDIIAAHMTLDNLPSVWSWACEPGGSEWIRRRAVHLLASQYSVVANSALLFDLEEQLLFAALKSDFLQAPEVEILHSVIKWGENQLVRRIEEREPNLLSGTTHSVSRKGVKRADLSDEELKEILYRLLPLVRTDFILPPDHHLLAQAIARGLVVQNSASLPDGLQESDRMAAEHREDHWVHSVQYQPSRPRFFLPYYEAAKALLSQRLSENPEEKMNLLRHRPTSIGLDIRCCQHVPDTLYMVDTDRHAVGNSANSLSSLDETDGVLTPEPDVVAALETRVDQILRISNTVKRGLACGCQYHRRQTVKQVRLRVLREFRFPDALMFILSRPVVKSADDTEGPTDEDMSTVERNSSPKVVPVCSDATLPPNNSGLLDFDLLHDTESAKTTLRSRLSYLERFQNYSDSSDGDLSATESGLVASGRDAACYYASASAVSEDSGDEKVGRKFYSEPKLRKSETISSSSSVEWPDLMPECSRTVKSCEHYRWETGDGSALSDLDVSYVDADETETGSPSNTVRDEFSEITENLHSLSVGEAHPQDLSVISGQRSAADIPKGEAGESILL